MRPSAPARSKHSWAVGSRLLLALGLPTCFGCGDGDATRDGDGAAGTTGQAGDGAEAASGGEGASPAAGGGGEAGAGFAGAIGSSGAAGDSSAECDSDDDCEPLGECYSASCEFGTCLGAVLARGSACEGGFCNGFARCLPCLDDAGGAAEDTGCGASTPVCVENESSPICAGCAGDADCDDAIACTVDRCVESACEHAALPAGASCRDGVCNGETGGGSCVACIDDMSTGTDRGCTSEQPRCDTSEDPPACTACQATDDCDDHNQCTADACNDGACSHAPLASGTPCVGGYCNGIPGAEICIPKACENDASCDDGVACTAEVCEASYLCSYTPDHTQCSDSGDVCRPNVCTVGVGCQAIDVSRSLELLANGYFEAGNTVWTEVSSNYPQVIFLFDYVPTLRAHTESYIAWLGGGEGPVDEHNSLSQTVSIPASSVRLELSFFYQVWSDDLPDDQNSLRVALRATGANQSDEAIVTFHNQDETRVWQRFATSIDVARWAGSDAILDFSGASVGGYTAFFIDTVSLRATVCEQTR